jgi:hypothetical protein
MKKGISLEDHIMCGAILKRMGNDISKLLTLMSGGYTLNSNLSKKLWRIRDDIVSVKSEAENAMFREHHEKASLKYYYGD